MFFYINILLFTAISAILFKKQNNFVLYFIWIVLAFIGFFRASSVGTDVLVYSIQFKETTSNLFSWNAYTEFEIGFNYLIVFFKTYISDDPMFFLGFVFLSYLLGVAFLIKKLSTEPYMSVFFMVALLYYTESFNIMRQYMAVGLICFLLPLLINKRNIILYILGVFIIANLFHRSTLIMLVLPLFYFEPLQKLLNKKNLIIIVVSSFILFSTRNYVLELIGKITFLNERYMIYLTNIAEDKTSMFTMLLNTLLCIYIILISPTTKNIYMFSFVLGIVFMNILSVISPILLRVSIPLTLLSIIYFPHLWNNIPNPFLRKSFRIVIILYCVVLFINAMYKNFGDIIPYENQFLKF